MKFRLAKKKIKRETGLVLRKTYPNNGYVNCCPHGYSTLKGMVGGRDIPKLALEQVKQWDSQTFCVDLSF